MIPFTQDVSIFYATIYGGILIGVLFDFYRGLRGNFKFINYFAIIFDVLFWFLATVIIFVTINLTEFFDLRYYHFVALFIGFILYYNTISKIVLSIINKIIRFVRNSFKKVTHYIVSFLNNLYYVIIYSLHLLFDIIFYIPNIFIATRKSIKRKSNNLRKKFSGQIIVVSLFLGISIFSMMTGFVFEYTKAKEYKKEIASLNKQLKKTEIQINSLKKDEKSYEGDLEDIARKRLNMVKPNETVYVDINR